MSASIKYELPDGKAVVAELYHDQGRVAIDIFLEGIQFPRIVMVE